MEFLNPSRTGGPAYLLYVTVIMIYEKVTLRSKRSAMMLR